MFHCISNVKPAGGTSKQQDSLRQLDTTINISTKHAVRSSCRLSEQESGVCSDGVVGEYNNRVYYGYLINGVVSIVSHRFAWASEHVCNILLIQIYKKWFKGVLKITSISYPFEIYKVELLKTDISYSSSTCLKRRQSTLWVLCSCIFH